MLGVRYVIFYQRLRAAFEANEAGSGKVGGMAFCTRGVLDMELGMHVGASLGVLRLNTLAQDPVPACVEKRMR